MSKLQDQIKLRADPKKCTKCGKATKKADGEGYNTQNDELVKFRLGRICERCKIVYLNPNYTSYEIIKDSDVGQ